MDLSDPGARPRKRFRSDASSRSQEGFQCQVCFRSYERQDHLNRHLDSHRNERPFRCQDCPAAFNRRDLLLRHEGIHTKPAAAAAAAAAGESVPHRAVQRATKACDACVISKVKCDNDRPCQRCLKKQIPCTTKVAVDIVPTQQLTPLSSSSVFDTCPATYQDTNDDEQTLQDFFGASNAQSAQEVSAFFEQIMVPELACVGPGSGPAPPNLAAWEPDLDWNGQMDLFGMDFAPMINETFDLQEGLQESQANGPTIDEEDVTCLEHDVTARRRHAIFQRSPWFWTPTKNQHAFSEHNGIALDERNVDTATSPHKPTRAPLIMHDHLSSQARDRIFQLVSRITRSRVSMPSFPSADCLDKLIKVGIAKRTETDAWIHPYTFDSEAARPEYLMALVAAGCVCFGIPSVSRSGLVLQEIVRVALNRLTEDDNSTTRDLQYLQASMIWLDIGAFCGYRRKMEIAESYLQPLVTALRRAGKFESISYPPVVPVANDSAEEISRKWKAWVEQEAYKRLIHHLFEHDIKMTLTKHRNPVISFAELALPLPAARQLWLAPSAQAWRTQYMATASSQDPEKLSLRTILANESALRCLTAQVDEPLALSAYAHGLAAQAWEYVKQEAFSSDTEDATSQLWLQSRHQRLYQHIQNLLLQPHASEPITSLFLHSLASYVHVPQSIETIVRFAGKAGESEAHRAYKLLEPWSRHKNARIAIYHAGQVLCAARHVPCYQLRGSDSMIVWHAVMVLWTWSMMRHTRDQGCTRASQHTAASEAVFVLDSMPVDTVSVDTFILTGSPRPCLSAPLPMRHTVGHDDPLPVDTDEHVDLEDPARIMEIGVKVLEQSHPDVERKDGPPLIRSLCALMEELAGHVP